MTEATEIIEVESYLFSMMRFRSATLCLGIAVIGVLLAVSDPAFAQNAPTQSTTKRLILKDGSYQIVTKWEIQGDRVHYYSAERAEWEDVPSSMVDWDATNQFENDRAAGKSSPEAQELEKELQQEREEEEAKSPHVAPGLRLPSEGGVYALDTYLSEPQLLPLDQEAGDINRNIKGNVLRNAVNPVSGSKMFIELPGPRSKIQVHAAMPTIYLNLEPADSASATSAAKDTDAELPWDRFRILRVQVKGDKRVVAAIKTGVTGKASTEDQVISATAEQLGDEWVKITPKSPLQPGEYALAEMLGKQGMNSYVWDFGIHPDAPANLVVIRPEQQKPTSSPNQKPQLKTRD